MPYEPIKDGHKLSPLPAISNFPAHTRFFLSSLYSFKSLLNAGLSHIFKFLSISSHIILFRSTCTTFMAKLSQKNNANSNTNKINNTEKKVKRTRRSVPRDSPPQRSSIYRGVTRSLLIPSPSFLYMFYI